MCFLNSIIKGILGIVLKDSALYDKIQLSRINSFRIVVNNNHNHIDDATVKLDHMF